MKIDKQYFLGHGVQILIVLITFILMYFGDLRFLIISLVFYGVGGVVEFFAMILLIGNTNTKISKLNTKRKIANGYLWVHDITGFIKVYNTNIYDFKKLGILSSFIAYLIMFIYVLIAFIFYKFGAGYYSFLVYLLPILTNIYFIMQNRFYIVSLNK